MLPYGELRRVHFAVIDRAAKVTIADARIMGPGGKTLQRFEPEDFASGHGCSEIRRDRDTVTAVMNGGSDAFVAVKLSAPVELPLTLRAVWQSTGWHVGLLLVGVVLAMRPVTRSAGMSVRWCTWWRHHPVLALIGVATATVIWQAHPVIFEGRSFVSPANGSLMLYGDLPTVPESRQKVYADGFASDTGAMLFQHLYYPMIEHSAIVRDHELPLWNRSSLCGVPLLGQGQSMVGDPLNLLTIFANGASWAWDIRFVVARWLLALGMGMTAWLFTRHLPSSVLTTVGAGFLGYFSFRLNHPANFSVAYAPWLLVGWLALAQAKSRKGENRALALLLVCHGIEFCSGTVKEAVVLLVMLDCAGFLLLLLWPETAPVRRRRLGLALGTVVLFAVLAAPFWGSFLVTLHHSYTEYDLPQPNQLPWRQIIGYFDEIFYRQNSPEEWVVAPALNFLFFAGLLCWLVWPGTGFRRSSALAITSLLCFAIGFDVVPESWIVAVPFLRNINHVGNEFSCVMLALLVPLAAAGFRAAAATAGDSGWWRRVVFAGSLAMALIAVWYFSPGLATVSPFARACIAQICVTLVVLAVALRWYVRYGSRGSWIGACVFGVPLLLWRFGQYGQSEFGHYVFLPGERVNVHARSDAVSAVNALAKEPARVIGFGNHLFPGYPGALGWESLYGVDALRNPYFHQLAVALQLDRVGNWEVPDPEKDEAKFRRAHDALDVRFYLADPSARPRRIAGLQRVASADLDVYESPTAWPRAFFTDRLARYDSVDDFARLLRAGDQRPFAAAQMNETGIPIMEQSFAGRLIRPASNYHLTANTTRFTIDAPGAGVAVLTETYYPEDFRVTVDGRPVAYFRVNHAFKGVAITAPGRHEIVMSYWPQYFTAFLVASAIGCVAFVVSAIRLARGAQRERVAAQCG